MKRKPVQHRNISCRIIICIPSQLVMAHLNSFMLFNKSKRYYSDYKILSDKGLPHLYTITALIIWKWLNVY